MLVEAQMKAQILALACCVVAASEPSGWPKADRWVSWWFMPYNGSVPIGRSAARKVVSCVRDRCDVFDSLIVFCGHRLELNGSLSVDESLLSFCEESLVGPLRRLGVVIEFVVGEGTGRNITAFRRAFQGEPMRRNIALLKAHTSRYNVSGWSFDWEPPGPTPTHADRLAFARMVGALRTEVSPLGARVTVERRPLFALLPLLPMGGVGEVGLRAAGALLRSTCSGRVTR